jgi:hypothetical protein
MSTDNVESGDRHGGVWTLSAPTWFAQTRHLFDYIVMHAPQLWWRKYGDEASAKPYSRFDINKYTVHHPPDVEKVTWLVELLREEKSGMSVSDAWNIFRTDAAVENWWRTEDAFAKFASCAAKYAGWCLLDKKWLVHMSHLATHKKVESVSKAVIRRYGQALGSIRKVEAKLVLQWLKHQYVAFHRAIFRALADEEAKNVSAQSNVWRNHRASSGDAFSEFRSAFFDHPLATASETQTLLVWWWIMFSVKRKIRKEIRKDSFKKMHRWLNADAT